MAAEANTPFALGFDLLFGGALGLIYGGLLYLGFCPRPLGVYTRVLQWGVRLMLVTMPVQWALEMSEEAPADRLKLAVALAGAAISTAPIAWRVLRARRMRPRRRQQALARWLQPLDYVYGVGLYLAVIVGGAEAATDTSTSDFGSRIGLFLGLFVLSQISAQFLFRFFSRAMRDDYRVSRGWHHMLVGVALVAAVVADLVIGASPAGPVFSVLLLGASWRYTQQRPASTLTTLGYLLATRRARHLAT